MLITCALIGIPLAIMLAVIALLIGCMICDECVAEVRRQCGEEGER